MTPLFLTAKEQDAVQQSLKSLVRHTFMIPLLMTLALAAFLIGLGIPIGVPKNEIVRVVLEIAGASLLFQTKMLVVVATVVLLWIIASRDEIEIFAFHANDRILSHVAELIRLWASLWVRLTVIVHLFARSPILRPIQFARMVKPHSSFVPGFTPQLE